MKEFYFIRHGEACAGPSKMDRDFHLTDRGRQQAHALGERLQAAGLQPARIYCSRLTRAKETARILREYVPAEIRERKDLIEHGSEVLLLDCSFEEAAAAHPDKLLPPGQMRCVQGEGPGLNWSFSIGGESLRALHARARTAWAALLEDDPAEQGQYLVVAHGSFLAAMLTEVLGLPLRPTWNFQFANAACLCVRVLRDHAGRRQPAICLPSPLNDAPL